MLSIKNVDTYYGAVHAIEGINMEVGEEASRGWYVPQP